MTFTKKSFYFLFMVEDFWQKKLLKFANILKDWQARTRDNINLQLTVLHQEADNCKITHILWPCPHTLCNEVFLKFLQELEVE